MKMHVKSILLFYILSTTLGKPQHQAGEDEHHAEDPEKHNKKFDHEAFLGKDESEAFDKLSPEESKKRLARVVDRIDTNNDGNVTEEELHKWVAYIANGTLYNDTLRQWNRIHTDPSAAQYLTYEAYIKHTYGTEEQRANDPAYAAQVAEMMKKDERRWRAADVDKDGRLTIEEFFSYLHPEERDSMRQVVIEETMESIDTNRDGFIDFDEYIRDIGESRGDSWTPGSDDPQPDWVKTEKEQFDSYRDRDKDGRLTSEEVGEWILPTNYDPVVAETKHLIYHADRDKDDILTREEILNNYDLFVGSQATDYGNALHRDEL